MIAGVKGQTPAAQVLVDAAGLSDPDRDYLLECSTQETAMALFDTQALQDGLVFDLGEPRSLESVLIWNYNKPAYTDHGVAQAALSVWTEKAGWKTILKEVNLLEAEGSDDYDEPMVVSFEPVTAQKVRLDKITGFNPAIGKAGLGKIRFCAPLTAEACNPEPASETPVAFASQTPIHWTAGKESLVHAVFLGENASDLKLQGRITGAPHADVEGLKPQTQYFWRIDEIRKDGTVTQGPLWSFTTGSPMAAHWKLDETEGQEAADVCGPHNAAIQGTSDWRPSEGSVGGAMAFDGSTYADAGNLRLADPVGAITVAAWIKVNAFDKPYQAIVTKGDTSWRLSRHKETDLLHFACDGLKVPSLSGKTSVTDGKWHHVAGVYDGAMMYLYLDGQLESSQAAGGSIQQNDQPVHIGSNAQSPDRLWHGMIDDVRLYACALSEEQVKTLCAGQMPAFASDVKLVSAELVTDDQSLEQIAQQAQEPETETPKRTMNLTAVLIILLAVVGVAFVTTLKKKN